MKYLLVVFALAVCVSGCTSGRPSASSTPEPTGRTPAGPTPLTEPTPSSVSSFTASSPGVSPTASATTTSATASASHSVGAEATSRPATAQKAKKPPKYPWHNNIVSTTFWVGEIFEPGPNGSQVISTYDGKWEQHYGGCDGVVTNGKCETEKRVASNGYFPRHMTPKQNPFYLDLPYDDVNDPIGAAERARVIPWATKAIYRKVLANPNLSLMKNHWVEIQKGSRVCYGQIEDAGPGQYHDAAYVFGTKPPKNKLYNHAGMDVSPALNGCLAFKELDGDTDVVRWRFVGAHKVPKGPWTKLVTRT